MFWLPSALGLLFSVYFILWAREIQTRGVFQASSATAFFHQWRIPASDASLTTLSSACTQLRSLAVV